MAEERLRRLRSGSRAAQERLSDAKTADPIRLRGAVVGSTARRAIGMEAFAATARELLVLPVFLGDDLLCLFQ